MMSCIASLSMDHILKCFVDGEDDILRMAFIVKTPKELWKSRDVIESMSKQSTRSKNATIELANQSRRWTRLLQNAIRDLCVDFDGDDSTLHLGTFENMLPVHYYDAICFLKTKHFLSRCVRSLVDVYYGIGFERLNDAFFVSRLEKTVAHLPDWWHRLKERGIVDVENSFFLKSKSNRRRASKNPTRDRANGVPGVAQNNALMAMYISNSSSSSSSDSDQSDDGSDSGEEDDLETNRTQKEGWSRLDLQSLYFLHDIVPVFLSDEENENVDERKRWNSLSVKEIQIATETDGNLYEAIGTGWERMILEEVSALTVFVRTIKKYVAWRYESKKDAIVMVLNENANVSTKNKDDGVDDESTSSFVVYDLKHNIVFSNVYLFVKYNTYRYSVVPFHSSFHRHLGRVSENSATEVDALVRDYEVDELETFSIANRRCENFFSPLFYGSLGCGENNEDGTTHEPGEDEKKTINRAFDVVKKTIDDVDKFVDWALFHDDRRNDNVERIEHPQEFMRLKYLVDDKRMRIPLFAKKLCGSDVPIYVSNEKSFFDVTRRRRKILESMTTMFESNEIEKSNRLRALETLMVPTVSKKTVEALSLDESARKFVTDTFLDVSSLLNRIDNVSVGPVTRENVESCPEEYVENDVEVAFPSRDEPCRVFTFETKRNRSKEIVFDFCDAMDVTGDVSSLSNGSLKLNTVQSCALMTYDFYKFK